MDLNTMNLLDRIAARFGYVKVSEAEGRNVGAAANQSAKAHNPVATPRVSAPGDFGLHPDVTFKVTRGGQVASRPASWEEAIDFLDACEIDINGVSGEATLTSIFAGVPFHIDGAEMSFSPIQLVKSK